MILIATSAPWRYKSAIWWYNHRGSHQLPAAPYLGQPFGLSAPPWYRLQNRDKRHVMLRSKVNLSKANLAGELLASKVKTNMTPHSRVSTCECTPATSPGFRVQGGNSIDLKISRQNSGQNWSQFSGRVLSLLNQNPNPSSKKCARLSKAGPILAVCTYDFSI